MLYNIWECPRCKHFASDRTGLRIGWCTAEKRIALKKYISLEEDPEYGLFKSPPSCPLFDQGKISPAKLRTVLEGKK